MHLLIEAVTNGGQWGLVSTRRRVASAISGHHSATIKMRCQRSLRAVPRPPQAREGRRDLHPVGSPINSQLAAPIRRRKTQEGSAGIEPLRRPSTPPPPGGYMEDREDGQERNVQISHHCHG